jgi:hypothetical protein
MPPVTSNSDLLEMPQQTARLLIPFANEVGKTLKPWYQTWTVYLRIFYHEFDLMRSVVQLVEAHEYVGCFIVLRTVFEYYFLLLLMLKGKKYKDTRSYRITPSTSPTPKEARDRTYEKWVTDWKSGKAEYKNIKAIDKGSADNVIHVTYETEALPDSTGEMTTMFFFAFDEYNPDANFLANLPTLYGHGPSRERIAEMHKHWYSHYLCIDRIEKNLVLNSLLTEEQHDRFLVHYNFLSAFVHPTRKGLPASDPFRYSGSSEVRLDLERLVLSYVVQFQAMLIRLLVEYFQQKDASLDLSRYLEGAKVLDNAAKDFWFIWNEPTELDIEESEMKKKWMRLEQTPVPEGVLYYADPVERIRRQYTFWRGKTTI